jgi:uncharacterized repeat protein (TIGR03803 family)
MRRVYSALGIIILVGCSRTAVTSSLPAAGESTIGHPMTTSSTFKTLFAFKNGQTGVIPAGGVVGLSGPLYGATNFGGTPNKDCNPGHGCGTIYTISQAGKESVLYKFLSGKDGARPYGGLTVISGTLYGTTQQGGKKNKGTVFSITTSGTEKVLHSFSGKDGFDPRVAMTNVSGVLYGTTYYGGSAGVGTLFTITTSGTEKVLHNFTGGTDGALPLGILIDVNNVLYGTASSGGANNDGIVFSINPDGSNYSVLHTFTGGADGALPFSGVAEMNGTFYGTTQKGGQYNNGTVYSLTGSGAESVIHNFGSGKDGALPYAGIAVLNGQLYGTTAYGGQKKEGTLYTITPSGEETVLHNFARGPGGRVPYADLTVINGALYGTTVWGGIGAAGQGTVFEYTP